MNLREEQNYNHLQGCFKRVCDLYNKYKLENLEMSAIDAARRSYASWMLLIEDLEIKMNVLDRPDGVFIADCNRYEKGWETIFKKLSERIGERNVRR